MRLAPHLPGSVAWTARVDPVHPAVAVVLARTKQGEQATVEAIVESMRIYQWDGMPGEETYDDVLASGRGNCLTLSCLLCASLTAARIECSYVLVAGGGHTEHSLISVHAPAGILTAHAWAVVCGRGGDPLMIDPVDMSLSAVSGETTLESRARQMAHVDALWFLVFNNRDAHVFRTPGSCLQFLRAPAEPPHSLSQLDGES